MCAFLGVAGVHGLATACWCTKSGHTVDLIIMRCADSLLSTNRVADCLFSDHFTVISDLIIKKPSRLSSRYHIGKPRALTLNRLKTTCRSQLYANTVPITLTSWSRYTTQHCITLLMHTLPLSPRPSNHGHLFHGTVGRLMKWEERDGKQKGNGTVPDVTLIC